MAKRTIASKYAAADRFASRDRKLLSFADHKQEIYSVHPEEQPSASSEKPSSAEPKAQASSNPNPQQASALPAALPAAAAGMHVPDAVVSSEHKIRSIVANKLKKSFEEIRLETSIKELSAGVF